MLRNDPVRYSEHRFCRVPGDKRNPLKFNTGLRLLHTFHRLHPWWSARTFQLSFLSALRRRYCTGSYNRITRMRSLRTLQKFISMFLAPFSDSETLAKALVISIYKNVPAIKYWPRLWPRTIRRSYTLVSCSLAAWLNSTVFYAQTLYPCEDCTAYTLRFAWQTIQACSIVTRNLIDH